MYFSQGLEKVQTKRHQETRQSLFACDKKKSLLQPTKAIHIFSVFSQYIVKTL